MPKSYMENRINNGSQQASAPKQTTGPSKKPTLARPKTTQPAQTTQQLKKPTLAPVNTQPTTPKKTVVPKGRVAQPVQTTTTEPTHTPVVKPSQTQPKPVSTPAVNNTSATETPKPGLAGNLQRVIAGVTENVRQQQMASADPSELYQQATQRTGAAAPFYNMSDTMQTYRTDLNTEYRNVVAPAYEAYKKAEQDYLNGDIMYERYVALRDDYIDKYNRYQPRVDAWNTIKDSDNQTYWNNADLDSLTDTLTFYDEAISAGMSRLDDLTKSFTQLELDYTAAQDTYSKAVAEVDRVGKLYAGGGADQAEFDTAMEQYNAARENLLGFAHRASELEGQYNAQQMYLAELAAIGQYGSDTYQKRYLQAHPDITWLKEAGLEYDNSGALIRNDTNFQAIYDRIEELRADNADGHNDDEIRLYDSILTSGLAYANMTADDLTAAQEFFQSRIDEVQAQLDELAWVDNYRAAVAEQQRGGFENAADNLIPEGQNYEEAAARQSQLKNRLAEAQVWKNRLATREYEETYDNLISGFSEATQNEINDEILSIANPTGQTTTRRAALLQQDPTGTGINFAAGVDLGAQSNLKLQEMLQKEGLDAKQIDGVLRYIQYEGNARRMDQIAQNVTEHAEQVNTAVNYVNQLMLGLGGGLGAIENIAQGTWNLLNSDDSYKFNAVDPYLGKVAPIDYNTLGNTAAVAAQAIGQGEYKRIVDQFVDSDAPEAEQQRQQRWAQFHYNMYNLAQSMGQSAIIGVLGGMGMKSALWLLSGSAAASTMQEMHQQGYGDGAVVVGGLVSGFAEYITEQISLGNLLETFERGAVSGLTGSQLAQALGKNAAMQMLAEGSEEGASDLINLLYDETAGRLLNGGMTQIQYAAIQAQQENPSLSWDEAMKNASMDWIKEFGQDMLMGAISGGLMGAGGYAGGYIFGTPQAQALGQQVLNLENQFALQEAAQPYVGTKAGESAGLSLGRGVETARNAGRVLQGTTDAIIRDSVDERLTQLGESEENITPALLRAIHDGAQGQHLLPFERAALANSRYGQQVMNELQAYYAAESESDLADVEDWATDAGAAANAVEQMLTMTSETGSTVTAQRANAQEMRFRQTQQENPNATVLDGIQDQLSQEGLSGKDSIKQGKLLGKIFSGEKLTGKEMRALDLNNPAVRKVFVERSGLDGIPSGDISIGLKATYANQVSRQSLKIEEMQGALAAGTEQLQSQRQAKSAARTTAMQNTAKPRNELGTIIEDKTRKGNNAKREQTKVTNYAQKQSEAARKHKIDTTNRTAEDIVQQVRDQSGNPELMDIVSFAQERGIELTDRQALDTAYRMYLGEANLTKAELTAMTAAAQISIERSASNDLQRGSGERAVSDDGQRGAESVREEAQGKAGTSKELGIPNGAEAGEQLREVPAEEVEKHPRMLAAKNYLTNAGIQAENVHFVQGNGDFIYVEEDGVQIPVRGVYDPDTQSVWILSDDPSEVHLTPREIAAHELFHHYVITTTGLFDAIVEQMKTNGVYDEAVRMAQENYAKSNGLYGDNLNRYLEEVMADANANVNTMSGANARQFNRMVRDAVADALLTSAADVAGTGDDSILPDIRTSVIEIPPEAKDAHHDSLGRKLAKRMDAFMANSWMREGLDEFIENGVVPTDEPLKVMYQGGGLGYLTFPDGRLTFWSDRPEVSRTYSQGKYEDRVTTTHVQEHTAARQQIEQLEDAYDSLRPIAGLSEENQARLDEIARQIRELHQEIEPFSKDIYAPSKYRDVFPRPPKTVEDAKKLVERYGAYNRSAKLVETSKNADEAALEIASPVISKAKVAVNYLTDIVNQLSQEINTGEDVEDVLGEPDWMQDEEPSFDWDESGESASDIAAELDGLRDTLSDLDDRLYSLRLGYEGAAEQLYEIFETLSEVDSYNIDDILLLARGWGAAVDFAPSEELSNAVADYYRFSSFDWGETTSLCRALYNVIQNDGATGYALDVKGLGTKKYFATDDQLIDYATELYHSTGGRGIYSCYLNITQPFVLDTKGLNFSHLDELSDEDFPDKSAVLEHKYGPDGPSFFGPSLRSRDVAEWAMDQMNPDGTPKYNGVILLNSQDTFGGSGSGAATIGGDKTSTVAITWNADVPKSTANTDPTHDSRITYSAVEDADAAVKNAMREFEWSENRSEQLNSVIQRLVNGENVSLQEMLDTIPEVIAAEKNSTRHKDVEWQPEWDADMDVAESNFGALGSYNSDAEGSGIQKWNGPVAHDRQAVFVLGPPAAGKSTVAVNELSELLQARILDKDEYRTSFTGNKNGEDASYVEAPSSDLRHRLRERALKTGENVIWPTVGRRLDVIIDEAKLYRDAGYDVHLVLVNVDRNTSMARSLVRSFPSDGHKARYTNLDYAETSALAPKQNFDAALRETYTAPDGTTSPLISGSAEFDNSVIGRNAVLVGKSTIPGFRGGSQKGNNNGRLDREIRRRTSGADRSESGGGAESLRDNRGSAAGERSVRGNDRRVREVLGRSSDQSSRTLGQDVPKNAGPNVKSTARAIENRAEVQQREAELEQARFSAVDTYNKAQRAGRGETVFTYDHSKSFAEQVDDYINGVFPTNDTFVVRDTPQVLRDLGFADLPFTYSIGHAKRVVDTYNDLQAQIADPMVSDISFKDPNDWGHSFGPEVLKQLPQALEDPIAVIRSKSQPKTSVVILVELTYQGKPFLAAVQINGFGYDNGRQIDSYAVTSFYPKDSAQNLLKDAIQVENQGDVVGVYYINEKAAAAVVGMPGVQFPGTTDARSGLEDTSLSSLAARNPDSLRSGIPARLADESTGGFRLHDITDQKAEVNPKIRDNRKTLQFDRWLGNSKLADDNGPRVLYHVTDSDQATKDGIGYRVTETTENGAREVYGRLKKPLNVIGDLTSLNAKDLVKPIMAAEQFNDYQNKTAFRGRIASIGSMKNVDQANAELVKYLKGLGYDGLYYQGPTRSGYVLFDANQIKAADNIGLYSRNSDNIRYSGVELSEKDLKKLQAIEHAKIDAQWAVGLAKSDGEQRVKELQRYWKDKFDYATKTDKQWARGLYQSGVRETKAEGKRRTKEAVTLDRKVHSLPATAALSNRRAVNRAAQAPINDNQAVATPLPSPNKSDVQLPKNATEFRELVQKGYDKFYRAMVNATQEIDRMAKLQTRTDNLSVWINVVRGARGTVERFYSDAMLDRQGNPIGPSMEETFLCHDADGKYDQQLQNALNDYMFHKHNIDRMSLKSRAIERVRTFEQQYPWLADMPNNEFAVLVTDGNPIALEYAQLLKEANEAVDKPVLPDADGNPVTAQTSQRVVDTYEAEMPWLVDKANSIYEWWDVFMQEWAVGTSITEDQYEHMREIYPHYVPTYRSTKNGKHAGYVSSTGTGLSSGEMVKKAKGSLAPLERMEDQFVQSMTKIVENNRQNDLLRNLVEELLFDDEGVFSDYGVYDWASASNALKQDLWDFADEQADTSVEKVKFDGEDAYHITCWVDGVKMSAYVNRAMFEGLSFLFNRGNETAKKIGAVGRKLTQPMKNMITGYNPTFALKNILRDQHTALTNSNAGIAYWKYLGQAAAKIAQNDADWVNFQALGGVSANETRVDGGFANAMSPDTGIKKAWQKGKEIIGMPGEISESVSRFAEYLATLDMLGGDTYENRLAAIRGAAEVTVDFGRSGYIGKYLNMWVPYWNANVQGLDKAIRNIAEQPDVKNMLKRTSRAVLVNLIPAAIQAALIGAMKRWKDYEELNDQQKDNYYCIPIPGKEHKFLKIPKSQDWAAFISTPFIRIMEGVNGRDDPMEGWFESAVVPQMPFDTRKILGVENVPVIMPIGLDWMLELAENKNWAGSDIIPYNLQKASAREQFDADTSLLAYYFGQMFNASPMQLDYILDDYFGNFWGVLAKSVPITPLVSRGIVSGETDMIDKLNDAMSTIKSPFVTDNRYSNSTMASYYDMLNQLEQEVTDAGAHGDKTTAEHYDIYQALTQTGGYVDQIRALTSEARGMTKGDEQANLKWEAAGLANLAVEFVQKCLNGEIEDPTMWMTYKPYGDTIMQEAESLKKYEDDFNFSGNLGKPGTIYDRSGDVDIKYDLTANPEYQNEYVRIRADAYRTALETVIKSKQYKSASSTEKAAMLEEAKREALKKAESEMLNLLRQDKVQGETVGKTNYTEEQRAAAYSVSWLLGSDGAYKPELTDEFVKLYDYNDTYSFIPTTTAKKTFKDQSDNTKVYTLNSAQQKKYLELYHNIITDTYSQVLSSPEYRNASDELRAAMLAKAKTYADEDIKAAFDAWLKQTGATATTLDQASAEITLEAKYAIQRALGDSHAMQQAVTDELVRLYQYSDVGDVQYFPITTAPKSYVDDQDKDYIWYLDGDQREMYMSMMFDIYQRNVLKVMNSSAYKKADDYGKAQLLCDVRSRLSGEVQAEFKNWLRKSGATRTYRKSAESQAQAADVEAAGKIVDQILGTARTYKQFSESRGYTTPKKKKK